MAFFERQVRGAKNVFSLEGTLFLILLFLQIFIFSFFIFNHLIPGGHDTFHRFILQYYFLNNAVISGEIPHWLPFVTHGTTATWSYLIQGVCGFLPNVLSLIGPLLKEINFVTIFYLGMFVDEFLLLLGVWLLAKRFFSPLTVFFVTTSVMGSCIWMTQSYFNLYLFYTIPLIIHLFHSFLETKKWRYVFWGCNLFLIQTIGNVADFLPVSSLIIFLYFFFYLLFNLKTAIRHLRDIRWGWPCFVCLLSIAVLSFFVFSLYKISIDQIVNLNPGREASGRVPLDVFLSYGGGLSFLKWLELFMGISPAFDFALYPGILIVPLILFGLRFSEGTYILHFFFLTLVILAFSAGGHVSIFFYYGWPLMKFFRHIGLISPVVKIFLCFLAGFGFEAIFVRKIYEKNPRFFRFFCVWIWVLICIFLMVLVRLAHSEEHWIRFVWAATGSMMMTASGIDTILVLRRLSEITFLFALFVLLIPALSFTKFRKYKIYITTFILTLHLLDIYSYKFVEISARTGLLNNDQYQTTYLQNIPYATRREKDITENKYPRMKILGAISIKNGATYWVSMNSFVFVDEVGTSFRTDHWLLPFDNLVRAYWRQSIDDLATVPENINLRRKFDFPLEHPAAGKVVGFQEDKIQFFSEAYLVDDDHTIASLLTDPAYAGDVIFLSRMKNQPKVENRNILSWQSEFSLSADKRLREYYEVDRFDSNHIEIAVDIKNADAAWLLYCDTWHPSWKATVNDVEVPVFKTNLAYKAVLLERGMNRVHFYFDSPILTFLQKTFSINMLFWLGYLIWSAGRILRIKEDAA